MEFITDFTLMHFRLNFKTVTDTFNALKRILGKRMGRKREKAEWSPVSLANRVKDLQQSSRSLTPSTGQNCSGMMHLGVAAVVMRLFFPHQICICFTASCFTLECSSPCPLPSWPVNYGGLGTAKKMQCDVSELHLLNLNEGFTFN